MPLFGGQRDIRLFRHLNREILKRMIRTEVDVLKINLDETTTNIYGESSKKVYYVPVRLPCLINQEQQTAPSNEFGIDVHQVAQFIFLRDMLIEANLVIEIGDIIDWNNVYWEIDSYGENQFFMGKDPNTTKYSNTILSGQTDDWGWNVSQIFNAHVTRKSRVGLEETRAGNK